MVIYSIKETLVRCRQRPDPEGRPDVPFVAVVTSEEWENNKPLFDMGIDFDPALSAIRNSKAEVNFDSVTGTFSIPVRDDITGDDVKFSFALDEKGVVFIDDSGEADRMVSVIAATKRWREPCLERFLYDFLELIIRADVALLEDEEKRLDAIEKTILDDKVPADLKSLNEIRGDMSDLKTHYSQLIDMIEVFGENDNGFFDREGKGTLRFFDLISGKIERLRDTAQSLWDYTVQLRDLYHTQMDVRQNHIMTILTVVTAIFMPLTLIAGWYGMNFKYMPELDFPWGYPAVVGVSLLIMVIGLIFFKKKHWL